MKKTAFSLAEALITLLVVSIIVAASLPVITKKTRSTSKTVDWLWRTNREQTVVYPTNNKDMLLGDINNGKRQGIVISGVLEFKDRHGRTIGWISENGENSFQNSSDIVAKQELIVSMLDELNTQISKAINVAQNQALRDKYKDKDFGGVRGDGYRKKNDNINMEITPEQMDQINMIQEKINAMMQQ